MALDGDLLVFVEVKQRKDGYIPEEAIGTRKIERLYSAARDYLQSTEQPDRDFRFDVIAITGSEIRHHQDVFKDHVDLSVDAETDDPEPYS